MRSIESVYIQHIEGNTYAVWMGRELITEIEGKSYLSAAREVERRVLRGLLNHPSVSRTPDESKAPRMVDMRQHAEV